MNIDPFLEIEHRFRYDFKGKKAADLLRTGAELVGAPPGVDLTAFELFEVNPASYHEYDLALMRDFGIDDVESWSALAWRLLKPGGWLYVGSVGSVKPKWAGWQPFTWDASGFELHSIYVKTIPDGFPFHVGTNQDKALFTILKTDRKTKRKPEEIGKDGHGLIVKWYLMDCTLYLRRPNVYSPYAVFDIGPREIVAKAREAVHA